MNAKDQAKRAIAAAERRVLMMNGFKAQQEPRRILGEAYRLLRQRKYASAAAVARRI